MYDLIIIGAGWAGFNAALRAKQLGLRVCLIEKAQLGGTCLNRGCIPTKALIQSAKIYRLSKKSSDFGVDVSESRLNFNRARQRKDDLVRQLSSSMQLMLSGVDTVSGEAEFISGAEISAGEKKLEAAAFIIAAGSSASEIPGLKFDGKRVLSSGQILELTEVPRSLLVIGGGVIGCEFASLFSSLGAEVTILEKAPQLIPGVDNDISRKLESLFKKRGIRVNTGFDSAGEEAKKDYQTVLVSVGRQPDIAALKLGKIGVKAEKGAVNVDEYLRTNVPHIYAAGDCVGKIMLAHFAAYQGRIAAQNIAAPGALQRADNRCVPNCVFTYPEVASVGLTQEQALSQTADIKVDKFDFLGSGMARILGESEGFIKIISEAKSGQLLGASIIGPAATEIIGILTLAVSARLKTSQLREAIFAHPTISEAIGEALKE